MRNKIFIKRGIGYLRTAGKGSRAKLRKGPEMKKRPPGSAGQPQAAIVLNRGGGPGSEEDQKRWVTPR